MVLVLGDSVDSEGCASVMLLRIMEKTHLTPMCICNALISTREGSSGELSGDVQNSASLVLAYSYI